MAAAMAASESADESTLGRLFACVVLLEFSETTPLAVLSKW